MRVSLIWLTLTYLLHTIGELSLSPVGLSAMTKLAPARIAGLTMGVWFLATSVGNYIGGRVAGFYESWALPSLFTAVAGFAIIAGLLLFAFVKPMRRMLERPVGCEAGGPGPRSDRSMVLEKYKQKRNFTSTPEPSGDVKLAAARAKTAKPAKGLFFCVQKHLASHLHYDFRLEWKGVLLSWAVPKGPSLDPKTKRLAMHVEDHPIEYGTFEGVIPEGYGAGIVMLWDQGTWKPESDDVDAALKKGDLKFTLDGYKLKGSWVLVRTGGRWGGGDGRSWLLIKHKDDWAGDVDIIEFAPRSVKSDGDFEDILAAGRPDVWHSNRPAKGGEAGAMLATIIERAAKLKTGGEERKRQRAKRRRAQGKRKIGEQKPESARRREEANGRESGRPKNVTDTRIGERTADSGERTAESGQRYGQERFHSIQWWRAGCRGGIRRVGRTARHRGSELHL